MKRPCVICGEPMEHMAGHNGMVQKFCSNPCRNEAKRRRAYNSRNGIVVQEHTNDPLMVAIYRLLLKQGFVPTAADASWWPGMVDQGYAAGGIA